MATGILVPTIGKNIDMPLKSEPKSSRSLSATQTQKSREGGEAGERQGLAPLRVDGQHISLQRLVGWVQKPQFSLNFKPCISNFDPDIWHHKHGKKRSADIDQYLVAESSRMKRHFRILLLGQVAQKDLFWKRIRLISKPLADTEREDLRPEIRRTIVSVAKRCLGILYQDVLNKMNGEGPVSTGVFVKQTIEDLLTVEDDKTVAQNIVNLHRDSTFHECLKELSLSWTNAEQSALQHSNSPSPSCSCEQPTSIPGQLNRVFNPDYKPTDHDWFHFDDRHNGSYIREAQVTRNSYLLKFIDLTGRCGMRKKWIHFLEENECIVFVADLALYDQYFTEDGSPTLHEEALILFDSIANSKCFDKTPLLLVLSNESALRAKLGCSPLGKIFPEFEGDTAEEAIHFLSEHFKVASKKRDSAVHTYISEVSDEKSVENIIQHMEQTVLKDAMTEIDVRRKETVVGRRGWACL